MHSGRLVTGRTQTNNGFFKLVEAFLQIHSSFFSHSAKLLGLPLSAVTASLQGLREGSTKGTLYPGPVGTGARADESTHAKFFFNQAQNL